MTPVDGQASRAEASASRYRFSLVIPARNEEAYLPRLLDSVERARARFTGGTEEIEVVLADNVSTDRTADLARDRGCRVVRVEKRIIGAVRNGGATAARGEVLAFVDADARIDPETFNAIDRPLATGKVVGGATGVKLERWSLGLAVTYAIMVPLVWVTGMDTGVTFCAREDFEAVGGYREDLRFAEDVQFLWDLRRHGRSSGRKLARATSAKALASTRKFDQWGDWHYFAMMARAVPWFLFSRGSMDEFAQAYWYQDRE